MKKGYTLTTAMLAATLSLPVTAATYGEPGSYWISAPVVGVTPIVTQRTVRHPERQCSTYRDSYRDSYRDDYRERHHDAGNHLLPSLFGGLVGGLIGNQFGGGNGKKALTIAGALAGSSIARNAAAERSRTRYPTEVCRTTYRTEIVEDVSAYDVTYEYAGRHFNKRMSSDPGDTVRVRVDLEPAYGDL